MADTSFTDMGRALDDAAAQYRDSSSVDTTPDTSASSAGSDETQSEGGTSAPQGEGSANLPKTDGTQVGAGDEQGKPSDAHSTTVDDKQSRERKAFNHAQAAARIARKRAKQQEEYTNKRARLEAEQKDYADKNSQNYNPQMAAIKTDQIREADIAEAQRLQNEFIEESYQVFQDEETTQSFIRDCQTYADWINTKEPELSNYIQKPYGKLVLKGWFDKIAKNPKAADWWESLTPFEKNKTLDRYYNEFSTYIAKVQNGEIKPEAQSPTQTQPVQQTQQTPNTQPTPAVQNAPVPGSGRNTNNMPPTNNFSLELERAMQLNGASRLVR